MNLVVDASVAVKWFVAEDLSDAAERILGRGDALSAPDLVLVEVANALWKKAQLGEIDRADADEALAALAADAIELQPTAPLVRRALALAGEIGHPVYDCIYLAAAEAGDGVVVTADRRFYEVARAAKWSGAIAHLDGLPEPR